MTSVHFYVPNGDLSGPAAGYIAVAMYHREQGGSGTSYVDIGPTVDYQLVDGEVTIDLEPNTEANAWQISERVIGGITRLISVPDSPTVVEYSSLPSLDGRTLPPSGEPEAAWWIALEEVAAGGTPGGGGGAVTSVNSKTGTVVLNADDLADGTAKKMLTAAERTKLAGVAAGATVNATDAALRDRATHTGTQTSASISDFTEAVQDAVAALLAEGTNVTLTYNDAGNVLTVAAAGGSGGGLDAEGARDAIGVALLGTGVISVVVNDAADTITISSTATANSTDAALRDRSTHTGTQTADTITDGTTNKAYTATANSTDAALRDRSTHTGTQTADTITDGTTNKAYTATEKTKLAGIAAAATANRSDAATDTLLSAKAPLASPTFTGTVVVPVASGVTSPVQKQAIDDLTTSVTNSLLLKADKTYVDSSVAASNLVAVNAQTTNYTLALSDVNKAVEVTSASAATVTVPLNSAVAFPIGSVVEVDRLGTGSVTLVATGGVTIRYASSTLALRAQYSALTIRKQATDTWLATGDMT
jgi:hypothetical protein